MKFLKAQAFIVAFFALISTHAISQGLDVASCAEIVKRSNGNGQASLAPGDFRPLSTQNNPVAANVVGTSYQLIPFLPPVKTGDIHFKWISSTSISKVPVITRVWITAVGSATPVLSNIWFGPPSAVTPAAPLYYVDYCFYNNNLPNAGILTLEFSDPQTGIPAFRCSYDLGSNSSAPIQPVNCSPTITTQPANQVLCGAATASFSVIASGATFYQWQVSNDGTNFTNITNGGNYTNATTSTLTISNPTTYDGKYYRVMLSSTGCTAATSTTALLTAKPKPTAAFNTAASLCGLGTKSLGVAFTGTAPYSLSYSNGSSTTTVNNITANPYYFSVSPAATTTYTLTSVSDAYCSNSSITGSTTVAINAVPTITPANASACIGSNSFNLAFTSSGSPNRYSVTAGTRALTGFTAISNATLSGSSVNITIPASGITAGTYDFNITVSNSATGCVSSTLPFTLTINPLPVLSASAVSSSVCAGSPLVITAAPSNLTSYSWSANPSASIAAVYNPTVTPLTATTYTVLGTDANGCTGTASVPVGIIAGPTLSMTPSSSTLCNGGSVVLAASGGNSYSWSPSTGLSATSGASVIASPITTTTYTVTSANSTGCSSVGTVTVTVNSPTVTVTPSSATVCAGSSSTLTASGASTYSWTPSTGLSASTGASVTATPGTTTTYKVVGTDASGCTAQGSATVTVSAAPVNAATSVSNNYTFCSTGTSTFALAVNTTSAVTSMSWSYSTVQAGPYTSFSTAVSPTGATFTPSTTGATTNATLTISGYSNGGYGGPRFLRLTIAGATCTYLYDIQLFDIKGSGTSVPSPIVTNSSICSGDATTLSLGSVNTGLTVQWQSATTLAGTYTNIAGATSTSYTTPALTATTYYKAVFAGNGSCAYTTGAATITVASALSANTVTPATNCTDGSSYITLTGSAITGGIYQWQRSTTSASAGFTDLVGATSQNYTLTRNVVPVSTWYRRMASTSTCSSNTSTAVVVYAPIGNNTITNSTTTFCATAPATTLTGSTPIGGDGNYVYAWQSSTDGSIYTTIAGATAINYTTTAQTVTTYYRRIVTSGGCGSSTSPAFVITVNPNPAVSISPASQTICAGTSVTLTASGANSYSWTGSDLSATTGTTVVATPVQTRTYTVTGTSAAGCTATSSSVTIPYTAPPSAPTVTSSTPTICSTVSSYNLNNAISGGSGVQWYTAPVANATYLVATPAAVTGAGTYYAFSKSGSCYSTTAASITLSIADVSKPAVAGTLFTACSPATIDLTALQPTAAAGTTLEWHTGNTSGSSQVASPAAAGTGTYYLFAYSSAGNCYGPASNAVAVTINSLPAATVSGTPAAVCYPSTVNLNNYNTTGNGTYTYQWYSVASSPSPATLIAAPTQVSTGGNYYLYATSKQGCKGAASSAVAVTINSKPSAGITAPSSVCAGSVISIPGSSNASSPSYLWEVSTNGGNSFTGLTNSGIYSGTGTSTLGISNSTGLDAYQYRFTVTSGAGCATISDNAIVSVDASTTISTNPTDTTVQVNGLATFRIRTSGSPTVNYQWKLSTDNGSTYNNIADGAQYEGTNAPDLLVLSASSGFNGYLFKCEISNTCTAATLSTAAKLSVNTCITPSAGGTVTASATVCSGTNSTLLTLGNQTGTILKWQSSTDNFGSVVNDINNTLTTYTASNLTTSTSYRAVVQSGGCAGAFSNYATISVSAPTVAGAISGDASKCAGVNATTFTLNGSTGTVLKWQSATAADFSGTVTDISNTTTAYTATNLAATTYYRAVVQSGVCAAANSTPATVTIYTAPVVTTEPVSSQLIATGNTVTLTVSGTNISSYQWMKNDADISGATSATLSLSPLTVNDGGVYKLKMNNTGCNVTSNGYSVTPSIILYSKSTGNLNIASNWGVNADGSGSTPVDFTRDEHTFVVANRASAATGGNLTIAGTLDLKDGITVISPATTLTAGVIKRTGTTGVLSGSNTSNLAITGISGVTSSNLWFATGSDYVKNLTISNVTTTLNTPLNIAASPVSGLVTVNNGATLVSNGNLTLKSNPSGSASVAKASVSGNYITGDVTVERYIPQNSNRAWRLLSIPTYGPQTIHQAWQENQATDADPGTGYGTILTSRDAAWQTNGYDEKTPGYSLLMYDQATDNLPGVPNTAGPIATTAGYFVYIRGDRAVKQSSSIASINPATLRTKGALYMGTQNAITVPADKSAMIGNIYASAIDVRNILTTGGASTTSFSVWDPKLVGSYGLGAYQTLTPDNGDYIITPGGGSYGAAGSIQNTIQSGQAFFVQATGADGSIQLTENAKTTGSSSTVFNTKTFKKLSGSLYAVTDSTPDLADGTLQLFDESFDNAVDGNDAKKMYNFGENFYITKASQDLIVEKRNLLTVNDTIFFAMESLKRKTYRLTFTASELNDNTLSAWLEDSYTKTASPLNLDGTTSYDFKVDANTASGAINRFRIVFKANTVLASTFTSVKAYAQNNNAAVEWKVTNQVNVTGYDIERSTNGRDFVKTGTKVAITTAGSTVDYAWLDVNAINGANYYRIVSIDNNGNKHYSQVVKVNISSIAGSISIYPNPVKDGIIKLRFTGMQPGNYTARLISANGAAVLVKQLSYNATGSVESIQTGNRLPAGNYVLELVSNNGTVTYNKLVIAK